ncbi:MAG: transketolase C-terminal domain-containing protein [Patescibacteria group bacterium]
MSTRLITYREAITEAIREEMERDERVFVYGLDVADFKRTFGSGKGLLEQFGPKRYFSTPLSEDALMGMGVGAAITGLRPVNVHIRVDFLLLTMNQLTNIVSCWRYTTGGALCVPLTIRAVTGRGWGQGMQHSKTMQSIFAHIPGLKVIAPSTAADVKGLLKSAIRDDNPVLVVEQRWLYDTPGEVPSDPDYLEPIGAPRRIREGSDITVVGISWMVVEAVKAAEILVQRGVQVEVIDPRTISPLDYTMIYASVKKTGYCIVADYDWLTCGFSAEVAARVQEHCFRELKSPVTRVGFAETPCPTTRPLENRFYSNAVNIIRTIEQKLGLLETDLRGEEFYSYENKFKGPF